jgi:hypothetical protein
MKRIGSGKRNIIDGLRKSGKSDSASRSKKGVSRS